MLQLLRRAGDDLNPFRLLSPGRILLVFTLVVAGYLLVSAGGGVVHSYRLASDEAELRQEVQILESQKDQLTQIRDYLRTDEYIEFMARRVFGLVKPGETLVVVQAPRPAGDAPTSENESRNGANELTWWQRLFGQ